MIPDTKTIPYSERKTLPEVMGTYYAVSLDGAMLYVGATSNLRRRLYCHPVLRKYKDSVIGWTETSDNVEKFRREVEWIAEYKPLHNKNPGNIRIASGKPPFVIQLNRDDLRRIKILKRRIEKIGYPNPRRIAIVRFALNRAANFDD